jgi:hypothetical protein
VTVASQTVAYGAANNANVDAIASGARYAFAPPTPPAPTGLAFQQVSAVAMGLSWTDNASNEVGYAIYRSLDGVTYTFAGQVPANTTSSTQTGLAPSTTYFWRVHAVTEGALSTALAGSQATAATGLITTAGSGNWSSTVPGAPWPGGVLPNTSDDVLIADGHTVVVDADAVCYGLSVGGGA